ncbi:hypothetical protein BKA81DRAFT_110298 [Phyllosticta paracitricarpa]
MLRLDNNNNKNLAQVGLAAKRGGVVMMEYAQAQRTAANETPHPSARLSPKPWRLCRAQDPSKAALLGSMRRRHVVILPPRPACLRYSPACLLGARSSLRHAASRDRHPSRDGRIQRGLCLSPLPLVWILAVRTLSSLVSRLLGKALSWAVLAVVSHGPGGGKGLGCSRAGSGAA